MNYKVGDKVYGYAYFHNYYAWCVIKKIDCNHSIYGDIVFGYEPDHENKPKPEYYMMQVNTIIPEFVLHSPLWQIMKED